MAQNITSSEMPQAKLVHCFITFPGQYLAERRLSTKYSKFCITFKVILFSTFQSVDVLTGSTLAQRLFFQKSVLSEVSESS